MAAALRNYAATRLFRSDVKRLLIVLACALAASAAVTSSAEARFLNSLWGPIKFTQGSGGCLGPDRCSAFPTYRNLGVEVFQYHIEWDKIAPTRPADPGNPNDPAYHWPSEFEFAVDAARQNGIRVMFLISGSPSWANGGRSANWAPKPLAFATFATAAARRYPSVDHWEIWGEPTRASNWLPQGRKGARKYARVLKAAYRSLNKVRRRNVVVGGMTFFGGYTRPPDWIRYLRLPSGRPPPMDWWGHNPFEARSPRIRKRPIEDFRGLSDIDTLWREIKRHYRGVRKRPRKLWLSEYTIQSDHGSYVFPYYLSRRRQARRLKAAYRLARHQRYVEGMGWYQLIDYPPSASNPTWGLMTYSGVRKPAFRAYRRLP
jgi:hypothetical protein